ETATLIATGCNGTVKWSNTSVGTSITVSVAGTYTAVCETICGESSNSNPIVITTGNTPSAPVISTTKYSLCNGETATLSATGCAGTVKWSNTSTGTSITVSTAGTYTATCTNSCGESVNSNPIVITTGSTPSAPVISTTKNSLCNGETATLSATGCAGTVKWSNTSTGTSITVSTAGTYTATCTNSCGESGNSNPIVITTGSTPVAPVISTTKNSLCNGETATLSATGCAGTVKWSNTSTGTSITVSTAGTYTATCTNSCGESGNSNPIVITTGSTPVAPVISTTKNSLCNGETATLSATGCAGTVKWSNTSTGTSITVSTAGTYTATCTNSCGESVNSNPIVITTGSTPSAPIVVSDKTICCDGEKARLTASGCVGILSWNVSGGSGSVLEVTTSGTYTATCSNSCGSSSSSNAIIIRVGVSPTTPVITSTKTVLCGTETATLIATGCNGTVKWSNTSVGTSITVSVAGTYTAVCETICGESGNSNPIVITTGSTPVAPVISTTKNSLCNGEIATLSATGCAGTVKWSNTSTGTSITVSTSGTYTASCMNSCGESGNSNSVVITTGSSPAAPVISSNKNSLCNGETATLSATGCAGTVKWSNTSTGTSITVSTSGTYTASCMNSCGESGNSNSVVITTGSSPAAPVISSNKNSLCNGETATLSATGCAGTVKWSNTSTGTSITVSVAGTYTASCMNSCGESGNSNSVVITTGNSPAAPVISSNKNSLCNGETATLSATGCAGTVKWSNTSTGTSITVSTSGTYTATCTNSCGESVNSNPIVITTGSTPVAPVISTTKNSLCNGETATLSATGCAGTVKWNNTSTGTSITVSTAGTYTATCTNSCGESGNSNPIVITTGSTPVAPVISTTKNSLCNGETATLIATGCNGTVKWSNTSVGTSITVSTAGTYTASCMNSCGESGNSNPIVITTGSTPVAPVISTTKNSLCNGEIATLSATGCAGTVKWSNTSTGTSITVSTAGTYTAVCETICGESVNSNPIVITTGSTPSAPVISTTKNSLCNGETATLSATGCA
ncbi:beta strand repeat-containing protein, partial [Emticicia aquatica]|uniref:beta strand repeat-containing protein n=1 Tax=Emticicia aquatica TaxID=1681835 RepID=UPI0035B6648B